jgi:hypothetical protein
MPLTVQKVEVMECCPDPTGLDFAIEGVVVINSPTDRN